MMKDLGGRAFPKSSLFLGHLEIFNAQRSMLNVQGKKNGR
jgi:hypothetical protein